MSDAETAKTAEQRRVILHALELDQALIGYRNRYIGHETPLLEGMRELGWLVCEHINSKYGSRLYRVTKRGLAAAGLEPNQLDSEERADMPE